MFIKAHQSRHSHKLFDDHQKLNSKLTTNREFMETEEFRQNKNLQKVTPSDKRRYKKEVIDYLKNNFTYNPKINDVSKAFAEQSRTKLLQAT